MRLPGSERDGLCHISEVSAMRTTEDEMRKSFPIGGEVSVKVLSVGEGEKGKIALSINQADAARPQKPPPLFSIHRASCTGQAEYAIFVRLESGWDAMCHTSQLDQAKLMATRRVKTAYPLGTKMWIKLSAVDGTSSKAKLQGSAKYVDQASGKDLDPDHKQLIVDLTSRGLASELDSRWHGAGGKEGEEGDGRVASEDFTPARTFVGARPGCVFRRGPNGLGYYRDGATAVGAVAAEGSAASMLKEVMSKLAEAEAAKKVERGERKERKRRHEKRRHERHKSHKGEKRREERGRRGDEGRPRGRSRSPARSRSRDRRSSSGSRS